MSKRIAIHGSTLPRCLHWSEDRRSGMCGGYYYSVRLTVKVFVALCLWNSFDARQRGTASQRSERSCHTQSNSGNLLDESAMSRYKCIPVARDIAHSSRKRKQF